MSYINYNGRITNEDDVRISPSNRTFRYADGFFETMKLVNGRVVLQELHLERLYTSLETMKFSFSDFPAAASIIKQLTELAEKNECLASARVRLTVFAGNGSLYDLDGRTTNYTIEASPLEQLEYGLNEKGLKAGIYKDAVKPSDQFSPVKSNNFLPYVMASIFAKDKGFNDCILLNPYGNVADATIANVFVVKDGYIKTPPLSDGPVNGVMRRHLIKSIRQAGIPFAETSITEEDILQASEVFLTNVIRGIRWVKHIGESEYTNQLSSYLHTKFIAPLTN